jgi:hypothetical protein
MKWLKYLVEMKIRYSNFFFFLVKNIEKLNKFFFLELKQVDKDKYRNSLDGFVVELRAANLVLFILRFLI